MVVSSDLQLCTGHSGEERAELSCELAEVAGKVATQTWRTQMGSGGELRTAGGPSASGFFNF